MSALQARISALHLTFDASTLHTLHDLTPILYNLDTPIEDFIYLSIHLRKTVPTYRSIYLSMHLSMYAFMYVCMYASIYLSIYLSFFLSIYHSIHIYIYPLCGETLEPLARFVRKLPKDSNLAENDFPGLINQEFLGSFCTEKSICSAYRAW